LASLDEAGDELTALRLLEGPNTLHKRMLSTNIEDSIRNMRAKLGRVIQWPEFRFSGRMALRRSAAACHVSSGFGAFLGRGLLPLLPRSGIPVFPEIASLIV